MAPSHSADAGWSRESVARRERLSHARNVAASMLGDWLTTLKDTESPVQAISSEPGSTVATLGGSRRWTSLITRQRCIPDTLTGSVYVITENINWQPYRLGILAPTKCQGYIVDGDEYSRPSYFCLGNIGSFRSMGMLFPVQESSSLAYFASSESDWKAAYQYNL